MNLQAALLVIIALAMNLSARPASQPEAGAGARIKIRSAHSQERTQNASA